MHIVATSRASLGRASRRLEYLERNAAVAHSDRAILLNSHSDLRAGWFGQGPGGVSAPDRSRYFYANFLVRTLIAMSDKTAIL
jgi:hypothetical protein